MSFRSFVVVAPANERWSSYHIIVISNQKLTRGDGGLRKLEEWRKKMPIICRDVGRCRVVFAAALLTRAAVYSMLSI